MNLICGIDPGLAGGVALLTDAGEFRYCCDMPVIVATTGRKQIDPLGLAAILRRLPPVICIVERVGARPGEGPTGAFSFGHSLGVIKGVLGALEVPYQFVQPAIWKRAAGIPVGAGKGVSITIAKQLIPGAADHLFLKKHDGRAKAMLIAHHHFTTRSNKP